MYVKPSKTFINGCKYQRRTTECWKILTILKDQSEMWVPLHQLKEFNTVQFTLFAHVMGVADEPTFSWLVPHTLKKTDCIKSLTKSKIKNDYSKIWHSNT